MSKTLYFHLGEDLKYNAAIYPTIGTHHAPWILDCDAITQID